MPTISITMTDSQKAVMDSVTNNIQDWVENALFERERVARLEIIQSLVLHCNANGIQIASGEDAQIAQAYELGVALTTTQREALLAQNTPE